MLDLHPSTNPGPDTERQLLGERRENLWMFLQILKAFIAKSDAVVDDANHWKPTSNFRFVHDFLGYFHKLGKNIVKEEAYERGKVLHDTLRQLKQAEILCHEELTITVSETQQLYRFLEARMSILSKSEALKDHVFDRSAAARRLATYLAHS